MPNTFPEWFGSFAWASHLADREKLQRAKFFHNHNNRSIIKCNGPKFSNPAFVVGGQVANGAEKFYCRLVPLNIRDPAGSLTSPGCQTSGDDDVDGTATVTGAHKGSKNPGKTPITATKPMALAVNSLQKKKIKYQPQKIKPTKKSGGKAKFWQSETLNTLLKYF